MKRVLLFACLAVVLLAVAEHSCGGWGPRGCASVEVLAVGQVAGALQWFTLEGRPDEVFLYRGNTQIGSYSYATGYYHEINAGRWGKKTKSPISPPLGQRAGGETGHTFGADTAAVGAVTAFSHNGQACSRAEVEEAIGANLRDDSKAGHVTYIDADAARRKSMTERFEAVRASNPNLADVRFQAYDPNKVQTQAVLSVNRLDADRQFAQAGRVLYAQAASAKADGTSPPTSWYGEITEAQLVEAVRKVAPDWDPNKAPVPFLPSMPSVPWEWILLGLVGFAVCVVAVRTPHN